MSTTNEKVAMKSRTILTALVLTLAMATPASAYYLHLSWAKHTLIAFDRGFAAHHPDVSAWDVRDCFRINAWTANCSNALAWGSRFCVSNDIVYYQPRIDRLGIRLGHLRCRKATA